MTTLQVQDLAASYDHLTLHIVPGPRSLSYFIPLLLLPAALLVPPSTLTHQQMRWTFIPISYAVQLYVWIVHQSFDVISMNHALITFMLLGWYDVRTDFGYIQQKSTSPSIQIQYDQSKQTEQSNSIGAQTVDTQAEQPAFDLEAYPDALWPRLKWVGLLCSSLRLTYWHIGLRSHDTRQYTAKRPFRSSLLNTIVNTMFTYVILFTLSKFGIRECCKSVLSVASQISWDTTSQAFILVVYLCAALLFFTSWLPELIVLVMLSFVPSLRYNQLVSPLTWPSHLGPLSSIYAVPTTSHSSFGLRAFWGVFWHQNMRQMTSTPGIALASWLGMARGSVTRYMVIVMSSFFWSGIVHMGVIPPEPIEIKSSVVELRIWLACFFWVQVIGIGIEVILQRTFFVPLFRRFNKSSHNKVWVLLWRILALSWTFIFLAVTTWWFIRPVGCEMHWWKLNLVNTSWDFS